MTIGEKIKQLRKKNDLTQEKLADYLCVSYQAVSKWETGVSNPDLSLIAPLTKLLHVNADELLGLTEDEPDARRSELETAYQKTWNTGDLNERYRIAEAAVNVYPGEMKFLDWFAWTEAMRSFNFKDDETYSAEQEKAIKKFSIIIENCTDDKIKSSAIQGITQYLQFRGRKDEALRYAELYPENYSVSKDDILEYCLSGDKLIRHRQKILNDSLYKIIFRLRNIKAIQAREIEEQIIKLFITDGNYLHFHAVLFECLMEKTFYLLQKKCYDEAIAVMEKMLYHAKEFDKIDVEQKVFINTLHLFLICWKLIQLNLCEQEPPQKQEIFMNG
jgi:transcriptional regulator with XRE-family HTH domain